MTNPNTAPSAAQPYAIDGVVYAIARKDQREAYVMFDTPAQANGFVEYMRRFIEKPEVASRDAGGAASGGQGEPTAFSPCPFCQHKDVGFARGTPDHFGGWDIRSDSQFVKCESCGAEGPPADWDEEARRLWNSRSSIQRAPTPPTDKELLDLAEDCNFSVWNRELYLKVVRAALGWRPKTAALSAAPPSPHPDHTGSEAVAPEARADVLKQLRTAMDVVSALCDGSMRWTMSVPARPDSDPDLVISGALHAAEKLIAAAPPAPPAPLPGKRERALFQAWARDRHWNLSLRADGERYMSESTQEGWYAWKGRAALSSPPTLEAAPADYPPHLADEVERELALMIDRCPEPLRRLSDWLANKLDEDDWKTAERLLLGAVESAADRAQRSGVSADPLPLTDTYVQPVPDKCDRITWRGQYYHLPVSSQSQPLAEPVGEILSTCGYKEASWRKGKLPPIGTKLYAAPQPLVEPTADKPRFQWTCANGCGNCEVKRIEFEYERTETLEGELVGSKTRPQLVSKCCGAELTMWDNEQDEEVDVSITEPAPLNWSQHQVKKGEPS